MILMVSPSLASQGKTNDPKYSGITRKIRRKETSHNKILAWNDVKQWNRACSKTGIVVKGCGGLFRNAVVIKVDILKLTVTRKHCSSKTITVSWKLDCNI